MASRAADPAHRLRASFLASHAQSVGGIKYAAARTHIDALPGRVEELLWLAGLEEDALALLQSIVVVDTECAKANTVHLLAVVGEGQALAVDAPLPCTALGAEGAVSREVKEKAALALVTVVSDKIEGLAVEVSANTRPEAQSFPLSAASKARAYLHASAFPHYVALLLAAETVARNGIISVAEGRDVDAGDVVARWHLVVRADDALADAALDEETLNAGEALSDRSVEVEALNRDCDTVEPNSVLALWTVDDNQCAGAISVQLVEVANAGETLAGAGVEGGAVD